MSRSLDHAGTPEAHWRESGVLDALPVLDSTTTGPAGRVVVVAPHPDDEVLGVGGLLATWAAQGTEVHVVAVTDGEASHPGSPTLGPLALMDRRREERRRALDRLGLVGAAVTRCRLPDGAVAGAEDELERALLAVLRPGDLCLAPRTDDGHPDHEAAARAAGRAVARCGAAAASYAVWFWHRYGPDDAGLDWSGAVRAPLGSAARAAKRAAVAEFTSQIAPLSDDPRDAVVLPAAVLDRLTREFEVLWWT